jgi:hypothetical protein
MSEAFPCRTAVEAFSWKVIRTFLASTSSYRFKIVAFLLDRRLGVDWYAWLLDRGSLSTRTHRHGGCFWEKRRFWRRNVCMPTKLFCARTKYQSARGPVQPIRSPKSIWVFGRASTRSICIAGHTKGIDLTVILALSIVHLMN